MAAMQAPQLCVKDPTAIRTKITHGHAPPTERVTRGRLCIRLHLQIHRLTQPPRQKWLNIG